MFMNLCHCRRSLSFTRSCFIHLFACRCSMSLTQLLTLDTSCMWAQMQSSGKPTSTRCSKPTSKPSSPTYSQMSAWHCRSSLRSTGSSLHIFSLEVLGLVEVLVVRISFCYISTVLLKFPFTVWCYFSLVGHGQHVEPKSEEVWENGWHEKNEWGEAKRTCSKR